MKLVTIFIMLISITPHANTLEDYQWKQRLLVIPQPTPDLLAALKQHHAGLLDRDIITIIFSQESRPIHQQISDRFQLTAASDEILLIGKDGRTTIRWKHNDFSIKQLFIRIDAMPMRQREIRDAQGD